MSHFCYNLHFPSDIYDVEHLFKCLFATLFGAVSAQVFYLVIEIELFIFLLLSLRVLCIKKKKIKEAISQDKKEFFVYFT